MSVVVSPSRVSILAAAYVFILFFFTATPTTEIYTLSLHDALPICIALLFAGGIVQAQAAGDNVPTLESCFQAVRVADATRSEEHTSELQSHVNLVCRLLLEKKKLKLKIIQPFSRYLLSSRAIFVGT